MTLNRKFEMKAVKFTEYLFSYTGIKIFEVRVCDLRVNNLQPAKKKYDLSK